MITRPLELEPRLSPPPRDFDVVFWLNAGVIALFFALLGSRFVLGTGLPVQVNQPASLELPEISSTVQGAASVVVSYRRDNMILFEGGIYELRDLKPLLAAYARKHAGAVMLVRVDQQVSMQGFLDLCELAREVGFGNVLVAAEPHAATAPALVAPGR